MHNTEIKIFSLNIEQDFHLKDRIIPFLQSKKFDVVFLQDVLAKDLNYIADNIEMQYQYSPLCMLNRDSDISEEGNAIFYKLPLIKSYSKYYRGNQFDLPTITNVESENMA